MKITEFQKTKLERRKAVLENNMPSLLDALKFARELGDTSENSELDEAISSYDAASLELSKINNTLNSAEVVPYDNSDIITVGSFVRVILDNGESKVFLVSDEGNLILDGVINTKSALGMAIVGNVNNRYYINDTSYLVSKVSDYKLVVDEFVKNYESSEKVLDKLFGDILK